MVNAFLFPGQGSQTVGMGLALSQSFVEAKEVFAEVDDVLNQHLSRIIFEGPEDELTATANTQPALMAVSIAAMRVLEKQGNQTLAKRASYVAGHSLGEYSALCAAGALSLADTARLLRIRGNAMQKAVPQGEGAMAAIIGLDFAQATALAEAASEAGICEAANDNGGSQVVLSGTVAAIEKAIELASEFGAKKAVKLSVSAPFHSSLMQPAADAMQDALADTTINIPSAPIITNVSAERITDPETIRQGLVQQVTGTVRWRESIEYLIQNNVESITEIGSGKVLCGLTKRIDRSIKTQNVSTPEDVETFLKTYESAVI